MDAPIVLKKSRVQFIVQIASGVPDENPVGAAARTARVTGYKGRQRGKANAPFSVSRDVNGTSDMQELSAELERVLAAEDGEVVDHLEVAVGPDNFRPTGTELERAEAVDRNDRKSKMLRVSDSGVDSIRDGIDITVHAEKALVEMGVTRPNDIHCSRTGRPSPVSFTDEGLNVKIGQPSIGRSSQWLHLSTCIVPKGVIVADEEHPAKGVARADVIVELAYSVVGQNAAG